MLPEAFLERMKTLLGDEYEDFLQSFDGEHYRGLRVNTRKISAEDFLQKQVFELRKVPWTENGFYYGEQDQPGKHPLHEAGTYYIQEPSAMAPVPFLEVKPEERVLDLCAAPGGKTTQLADAMEGKGILVSNEIHPARAKILSENVERMGVVNCIVTNETPQRLADRFPGYFDKVLVDAPCSGEGMFRKREVACEEWSPENVTLCAERQDEVLSCAARMLAPGGRLVYSTCTFAPEEDEGTISRFLHSHEDFRIVEVSKPEGFMSGKEEWIGDPVPGLEHTMRLMPHQVQGEGHYLAVLQRAGEAADIGGRRGAAQKSIPEREYSDFLDFRKQFLIDNMVAGIETKGVFLRFGDQLYMGPADMPALKGLKVLRPGLHLGTVLKNRFEPSHALALALRPAEAKQVLNLDSEGKEVKRYLSGQALMLGCSDEKVILQQGQTKEVISGGKGWCLICVDGLSLGWGKLSGNMMKNHYPKGLRKNWGM